jgi:hypothetical protein
MTERSRPGAPALASSFVGDSQPPAFLKLWTDRPRPDLQTHLRVRTINPTVFSNCGRIACRPQLSEKRGREEAVSGARGGEGGRPRPQLRRTEIRQNVATGARWGAKARRCERQSAARTVVEETDPGSKRSLRQTRSGSSISVTSGRADVPRIEPSLRQTRSGSSISVTSGRADVPRIEPSLHQTGLASSIPGTSG